MGSAGEVRIKELLDAAARSLQRGDVLIVDVRNPNDAP